MIFKNAVFHTMENELDIHRSMTVKGGQITSFDEEGPGIDLGGLHVFPAMTDAHVHLLYSIVLAGSSFFICSVKDGCIEPHDMKGVEKAVRDRAVSNSAGIIVCNNYITSAIAEQRLPTRFELDEWTGGRCVVVYNWDGHSGSCSTPVLEELGIGTSSHDGVLRGEEFEFNMGKLTQQISRSITPASLGRGIAGFCNDCASWGIASVCALDGNEDVKRDTLTEFLCFIASRLPIDIRLFPQYMDEKMLARVSRRMGRKRVGGCAKWELDGSISSRTASVRGAFADGSAGRLYYDKDFLRHTIEKFDQAGYQVTAHSIGEQAIEQLSEIYAGLAHENSPHRIDHCELPSPVALEGIYKLRPFITVQPGFAWMDQNFVHGYEQYLTAKQRAQLIPLKDMADHGVLLCGSSDSPCQNADPFLQMRGMRDYYNPEQSLSAFEALKSYTVNNGEMLGEMTGLLKVGYEGNFFTIKKDLLSIPPAELEDLRVNALFIRGRRYRPVKPGFGALIKTLMRVPHKI